MTRLGELRQRLSDTARVTGDGCMGLALDTYQLLKRLADSEGIEATVDRLARRFENVAAAARRRASSAPAAGGAASPAPSSGSAPAAAAPNIVSLPASAVPLAQGA